MKVLQSKKETSTAQDDVSKSISNKLNLNQKDSTTTNIQQLEATIANPTTSFIDKTRARLELALLQGEDESNRQSQIKKEIDAIKEAAGVAKTKNKLEQGILTNEEMLQREKAIRSHQEDLAEEALQRRVHAKRRAEEQRKRAKDAEELLSQLEKEAEEAIAKAKDAMKKANAAWVEAGREQKKALELELEAQNEKLQQDEDDDGYGPTNHVHLNIELGTSHDVCQITNTRKIDSVNALGNPTSPLQERSSGTGEGYFTKYFKLSIKMEELQKERDELNARSKEQEATIENLRVQNKLHEEQIMSLNKIHHEEVVSLNEYIKETGQTQLFWKHRSKHLADKVVISRQKKSEQEKEVMILKDQLDIKLKEIDELRAEIKDLRQTKDQFEVELEMSEETLRSELLELEVEADALLAEKEHTLNTLQLVHNSHLKVLADHQEQVNALSDDIAKYKQDLEEIKKRERDGAESDTLQNDIVKQLSEECNRWKKKATTLILRLDVLKDEANAQKREIARLKKSTDQDKLFSRLLSDYKLLKKKAKDLQLNLCVIKKEVRERDAKVKERDAIIDELTQREFSTEAAPPEAGQKSATYWRYGKIIYHTIFASQPCTQQLICFSLSLFTRGHQVTREVNKT